MPRPFAVIGFTVFFTLSVLNQANTGATVAAIAVFLAALVVTLLLKQTREAKVLPVACISGILACALLVCSNNFIYKPVADYAGKTCDLTVRLTSDAQLNYGNYYYEGKAVLIDGEEADFKIRLTFSSHPEFQAFDIVSGRFNMYLPGSTSEDLLHSNKSKGIYLAAYPDDNGFIIDERNTSNFIEKAVYNLRNSIKDSIYRLLPNEYGGLAVALILGDKTGISDNIISDFNKIGITHLICVSGLHLSLWSLLIFSVFKKIGLNEKISAFTSAIFVVLFMLVAGMTYSVVRAGIMMLIYLLSVIIMRQRDSLNSLGFAIVVMAVSNPFSVGSVGLQLSVLSTAGIILYFQFLQPYVFESLEKIKLSLLVKFLKILISSFAVTGAAVVFTLPLTLILYKSFNFAVFISNFLTVTAAGICMVLCAFGAVIGLLSQSIFNLPAFLGGLLCKYIVFIADVVSEVEFLTFRIEIDKAYLLIVGIFLLCSLSVLLAYRGINKPIATLILCSVIFVGGLFVFTNSEKYETRFKVLDCGNSTTVLMRYNDKNYLFGCEGTLFSAENNIIESIDFAGGIDYIFITSENDNKSSLLIPVLKRERPEKIFCDTPDFNSQLLLDGVEICSTDEEFSLNNVNIRNIIVNDSNCFYIETEDMSALICLDYISKIRSIPSEYLDFDILICKGDYPKDIFGLSPEAVIVNAENSRGVLIQNELISCGINSLATAECGNIIIRADNGNISVYRE